MDVRGTATADVTVNAHSIAKGPMVQYRRMGTLLTRIRMCTCGMSVEYVGLYERTRVCACGMSVEHVSYIRFKLYPVKKNALRPPR